MSTHTVKKIDEMEGVYLGAFKRARAVLGVGSFGVSVIDLGRAVRARRHLRRNLRDGRARAVRHLYRWL